RDSPNLRDLTEGLQKLKVPHEILDSEKARFLLPHLKLAKSEVAIFTPEAGWVDAGSTVGALLRLCDAAGVRHKEAKVSSVDLLEQAFDRVVLAVGSWIKQFVNLDVKVSLQTFAYLDDISAEGPVWIEDSLDNAYGFPTEPEGQGIKVALHSLGPEINPDETNRRPYLPHLTRLLDVCRTRFDLEHATLSRAKGCLYTNTHDEGFRYGELGPKTVWISACSGHGFKFGLWSGRLIANLAEGIEPSTKIRDAFRR
nr:FAD-dependent oxidoreductase [Fimbriimonadaceae bacterium]